MKQRRIGLVLLGVMVLPGIAAAQKQDDLALKKARVAIRKAELLLKRTTAAGKAQANIKAALRDLKTAAQLLTKLATQADERQAAVTLAVKKAKAKAAAAKKAELEKKKRVAALRARAAVAQAYTPRISYRPTVDATNPTERVILFTAKTPVIIEMDIFVDGQPFRIARDKLVDQMMKQGDLNKDGKVTWAEAMKSPRFHFGRFVFSTDRQAKQFRNYINRTLDINKNGIVERIEAVRFMAMYFQDSFSLSSQGNANMGFYAYSYWGGAPRTSMTNVLKKVLDTDKDGSISKAELAASVSLVKSRDANDDDVVEANELTNVNVSPYVRRRLRGRRRGYRPTSVRLDAGISTKALHGYLTAHYGQNAKITKESFADRELFVSLDKNKNGTIDQKEVAALSKVRPHLKVELRMTKDRRKSKMTVVQRNKDVIRSLTTGDARIGIELGLTTVTLVLSKNRVQRTYNYRRTAASMIKRYDKDKNKYIDKKEAPPGQFARWDLDGNGMVYAKEIEESYSLQIKPQSTNVRANVQVGRDPLFTAADTNNDSKLSARELLMMRKSLLKFDTNKDGTIAATEIPKRMSMTIGSGLGSQSYYPGVLRTRARTSRVTRGGSRNGASVPKWFTAMDRNSDGDITLREFLGNEKQFKKLDKNNDGFIDANEAK